ncbi:MAG: hypothetical protein K8R48_04170 [Alphaproteobacteria bacterium]|nr:hypothetical protein [Alphaproteobacteria bacterium]
MQLLFTQNDLSRLSYLQEAGNLTAEDALVSAIYIAAEAALRDSRRHEGPLTAGRVDAWNEPHGTQLDPQTFESRFAEEKKRPADYCVEFNFDDSHVVHINGGTLDMMKIGNSDIREVLYFAAAAVKALEKEGAGAKLVAGNYDGVHLKPRTYTRLRTPFDQTLRAAFGRMLRGKSGKKPVKATQIQTRKPSGTAPAL